MPAKLVPNCVPLDWVPLGWCPTVCVCQQTWNSPVLELAVLDSWVLPAIAVLYCMPVRLVHCTPWVFYNYCSGQEEGDSGLSLTVVVGIEQRYTVVCAFLVYVGQLWRQPESICL